MSGRLHHKNISPTAGSLKASHATRSMDLRHPAAYLFGAFLIDAGIFSIGRSLITRASLKNGRASSSLAAAIDS